MSRTEHPSPGFLSQYGPEGLPGTFRDGALAIGNFDGVHRGHQAVLGAALAEARSFGGPAVALTFEPHPRQFFAPSEPLFRLTPLETKAVLLQTLGLSGLVVMSFDARLAGMEAEVFIEQILVRELQVRHVSVGFDFHFGRARRGTPQFLAQSGERQGFGVTLIPPLLDEGEPISSSRIRSALGRGDVAEARRLLGYSWILQGTVVRGDRRGRLLGYPTANLRPDRAVGLAYGIYAVRANVDGRWRPAVASFGRRPTFGEGPPLLEVHLFDFDADLYGRTITVAFLAYLRPEERFESAEALVRRMEQDSIEARRAVEEAADDPLLERMVISAASAPP